MPEYNSDFWRLQLQKEGVRANVSAGEAHWQLGRTEKHGNLIKSMLTRMDSQDMIKDAEDFKRCLREAVRAKNALSRVKGYTPEQAVLGRMSISQGLSRSYGPFTILGHTKKGSLRLRAFTFANGFMEALKWTRRLMLRR